MRGLEDHRAHDSAQALAYSAEVASDVDLEGLPAVAEETVFEHRLEVGADTVGGVAVVRRYRQVVAVEGSHSAVTRIHLALVRIHSADLVDIPLLVAHYTRLVEVAWEPDADPPLAAAGCMKIARS